jgi:hypothetical protein
MGKSAPKAPDYTAAAQAQADSSREVTEQQTWANRPDQVTPFGSQTWSATPQYDPATGQTLNRWTQTTSLTPEAQKALDSQLAIQQGRSDLAGSMMDRVYQEYGPTTDWSQFSAAGTAPDKSNFQTGIDTSGMQKVDPSSRYYQEAGDALWKQYTDRTQPLQQQEQARLDQILRNRGIKPGDAAYDDELKKLRTQQSDANQNAAYQASQLAGQEAARMFGMDSQTRQQQFGEANTNAGLYNTAETQLFGQGHQIANLQTQLRQQQIAEEMQKRGFSLNEINAILSGQQVNMPSMPGFSNATAAQPTNFFGAAQNQYGAALDASNAQNALFGGLLQGGASIAGMFSDMRMKHSIRRVGTTPGGSRLYAYKYHGGLAEHIGVLAQIEQLYHPENVGMAPNGMLFVNYAGIK